MWNCFHLSDGQNLKVKQYQLMGRACGGTQMLIHFWWERKTVKLFWKPAWYHLLKLNIHNIPIIYDLLIPLFCVYLREIFLHFHQKSGSRTLTEALLQSKNFFNNIKNKTIQISINNGKIMSVTVYS